MWRFVIIILWILELWPKTCFVRSQWPWPLTPKSWSVHSWVQTAVFPQFEETPSRCSWDIGFMRMRQLQGHRHLDHQNLISSLLSPSGHLCKIWINSFKVLLRYCIYANETDARLKLPLMFDHQNHRWVQVVVWGIFGNSFSKRCWDIAFSRMGQTYRCMYVRTWQTNWKHNASGHD